MADKWERELLCAIRCNRCHKALDKSDDRILSAYDHDSICMVCKRSEEKRDDYEKISREMIGQCIADAEMKWGDPGGYCYHHFYPFKCD